MLEQLAAQTGAKARFFKARVGDTIEAASALGIMGLPTVVFFKDGQEVDRQIGAAPLEAMKKRLERVLS